MNYNAKDVVYQTPNGGSALGYLIDGKTYKDREGKTRVDIGSVVPTDGGTFMLTQQGGVKVPGSIANDISRSFAQSEAQLGIGRDAKLQGIDAAKERTINQINNQRTLAAEQYEDANRQAYQAYINASNPYGAAAEQRAMLGLANSGYSESSQMQLANSYQQALNQNGAARDAYLRELDNAYREAKYNNEIERANAISEYAQLVYRHGIDAAEAIANQQNAAFNYGLESNERLWEREAESQRQAREWEQQLWDRALELARAGFSNSKIAETLGVSLAELERITEGRW